MVVGPEDGAPRLEVGPNVHASKESRASKDWTRSDFNGRRQSYFVNDQVKRVFESYDKGQKGFIHKAELRLVLEKLDVNITDEERRILIEKTDPNNDDQVNGHEFLQWWNEHFATMVEDEHTTMVEEDHEKVKAGMAAHANTIEQKSIQEAASKGKYEAMIDKNARGVQKMNDSLAATMRAIDDAVSHARLAEQKLAAEQRHAKDLEDAAAARDADDARAEAARQAERDEANRQHKIALTKVERERDDALDDVKQREKVAKAAAEEIERLAKARQEADERARCAAAERERIEMEKARELEAVIKERDEADDKAKRVAADVVALKQELERVSSAVTANEKQRELELQAHKIAHRFLAWGRRLSFQIRKVTPAEWSASDSASRTPRRRRRHNARCGLAVVSAVGL